MKLNKIVLASGLIMSAVTFAPVVFAADTSTVSPTPITSDSTMKVGSGIKASAHVKGGLKMAHRAKRAPLTLEKMKANFDKEIAAITKRLDTMSAKGVDVTLTQAKLDEAKKAGDSSTDRASFMAARKLLISSNVMASKLMKTLMVKTPDVKASTSTTVQ